ncbi:vitamin B12-dependent ribonucleotide reductase [Patescibacteria group bacterium]|nr:vitamin B12-dependent ribonucleotide reductase [Patescibacteria group bacterium]MBU1705134.1 vitamin B12-dependent ribonucleotide reductase [Patescibacteria group bacterium]
MMNPNSSAGTADAKSVRDISDKVWEFVTSVKSIKKRNGSEEDFSPEKLYTSIWRALVDSGMKDPKIAEKITLQAMARLTRAFDGHTVPTFSDVRENINLAFVDNNLAHATKAYMSFRMTSQRLSEDPKYGRGLTLQRHFTTRGVHPYDQIEWEKRDARITNDKGEIVFEQKQVEMPKSWSQTATNVVVSKYFRGKIGAPERETSVKQLVGRVATTIASWGRKDGYFQTVEDADTFEDELTYILVNQIAAFNSPVWFNVGVAAHPQCSACFINSVQDDMRSILNLTVTEGMLFKGGSGTGTNFSTLRSSHEYLGGSNGKASGPVSFMKGLDAFAGVIKSGGKTRRAAKMVILNADHPDIDKFITCKVDEEKKAWALMDAGYDGGMDGSAYSSIYFQNANNSVRVNDKFMRAVENDEDWVTKEVMTGRPSVTYRARDLMRKIADATWQCGDPGMQFDTTINNWHTCSNTDRIHASNPCSEYMFLNDSACNLASLNLMKFRNKIDGEMVFDAQAFIHANEIVITAMEIIVGNSSYPTPAIEQNSFDYRPLGIGYANLGALLMSRGLAYDSDAGRNLAAAITSLMTGACYRQSARIAAKTGPFANYKQNEEPCLNIMQKHRQATYDMNPQGVPQDLLVAARQAWDGVIDQAGQFGLRNAQISVLAPTGTISFLMDCDTTGIEPDIALVKYKWLVGGGMMKIVNQTVPEALDRIGHDHDQVQEILNYINEHDTIEGAPYLKDEHLSIFDCAFRAANGTRCISYMGHIRMMSAVQPFLSGAISKTVNMPTESTVEDVEKAYLEAWRLGIKAVAIYRDGSKRMQPLTTTKDSDGHKKAEDKAAAEVKAVKTVTISSDSGHKPRRHRLPDERRSITHKFVVANYQGYITVGLYDDGTPGELFVTMSKEGSVISGLMDSFSTAVSIGLQYGVPLEVLVNKFVHMRFEPSGYTNNPNIRIAKSLVDYIFRWLAMKFLPRETQMQVGINVIELAEDDVAKAEEKSVEVKTEAQPDLFGQKPEKVPGLTATFDNQSDAPACDTCGSIMVRNGACYKCLNCGATSGCS